MEGTLSISRVFEDIRYADWRSFGFYTASGLAVFLFGVLVTVGVSLIGAMVGGWSLSHLWNWFVVPIFGLQELTFWQAVGIALIIRFPVTYNLGFYKSKEGMAQGAIITVLAPLFPLLLGWIVHIWFI